MASRVTSWSLKELKPAAPSARAVEKLARALGQNTAPPDAPAHQSAKLLAGAIMDSQAAIVPLSNKDYQNMEELTASRARLQAVLAPRSAPPCSRSCGP